MSPCTRARQASKDWYVRIVRDAGHPAWLGLSRALRWLSRPWLVVRVEQALVKG